MRHIILISGKDSLATALVQRKRLPDLPYEFVFNETGWELPESWEWISRVEGYLGKPILRLGDDLDAICREENCLPLAWRRFCTRRAKIEPLENYLGKDEATIYLGLRADEPERVGYVVAPGSRRQPAYPLREVGMGIAEVWRLCESVDLLPPQFHWAWMENRVRQILCGDSHLIDGLEPWERGALFAWRSRNNCSICFFKRLYEWVGLWEFYPSIFSYGCELEAQLCHSEEFGWLRPGHRLSSIIDRAETIKERRAKAIVRYLRTRQVRWLFEIDEDVPDLLSVTSCGFLCGK